MKRKLPEDEIIKTIKLLKKTDSTKYPILYYRIYRKLALLMGISPEVL